MRPPVNYRLQQHIRALAIATSTFSLAILLPWNDVWEVPQHPSTLLCIEPYPNSRRAHDPPPPPPPSHPLCVYYCISIRNLYPPGSRFVDFNSIFYYADFNKFHPVPCGRGGGLAGWAASAAPASSSTTRRVWLTTIAIYCIIYMVLAATAAVVANEEEAVLLFCIHEITVVASSSTSSWSWVHRWLPTRRFLELSCVQLHTSPNPIAQRSPALNAAGSSPWNLFY